MSYRPDIDGLRAVAVLSVLFYHAHLGFPGGYVGVDVFFVISGFLITGLLLKAIGQGTFSYTDFWERRVRRLVPALAVVTIFTALTSYFILLPEDLEDLGGALIAQPLLLSNVYFWRVVKGGYFGDPPEIRPLLHTWSLGVEEQFYVLFPLLLVFLMTRQSLARHVGKLLAGIAIVSLSLAVLLTPSKGVLSFFTLPTRAWELLMGGLVALHVSRRPPYTQISPPPRTLREILALSGLGLIAWTITFYHGGTPFPGYAAIVPCLGTALLIWANSHSGPTLVGKLLSRPFMVRVGQISYSLYLWHWPLIASADYLFLLEGKLARCLVVLLSCWLGYLSWRYIETPFRKKRWLASRRAIFGLFLVYAMACIGLGGAFRFLNQDLGALYLSVQKPIRSRLHEVDITAPSLKIPSLGRESSPPSFLLWGDSHAMSLAPLLDALGKEYGVQGLQLTRSATAPLIAWGYASGTKGAVTEEFTRKWRSLALEKATSHKLQVVFLVGSWKKYSRPSFSREFHQTVREMNQYGVQVIFVCDNPTLPRNPWRQARLASRWSWMSQPTQIPLEIHREKNRAIYEAAESLPSNAKVTVVDLAPTFLERKNLISDNGEFLYYDSNHLSDAGAMQLRPLFEPIFKELAK